MKWLPVLTTVCVMTLTPPASADWTFDKKNNGVDLRDDTGLLYLTVDCSTGDQLTGSYWNEATFNDDAAAPFPDTTKVRLEITVDGQKTASFPVTNDFDASSYDLDPADSQALWSLVAGGAPLVADVRVGKKLAWKGNFTSDGYDGMKETVAKFCQ